MLALTLPDQSIFMQEMINGTLFDHFLCSKVVLHHNVDYVIDGRYNLDFFDSDERAQKEAQQYCSWTECRSIIFQMMKGSRLPQSFQIVLAATRESMEKLLEKSPGTLTIDQVEGLFLNINYQNHTLHLTTGSSYSVYTMDRSLDQLFEEAVVKLLQLHHIPLEKD